MMLYHHLLPSPQVHESQCPGSRPESELPCTNTDCPSWYAGEWSGVSHDYKSLSIAKVKFLAAEYLKL